MINKIAKCGCDCFNCPTFKDNIRTIDERIQCSTGWKKYLDIKLSPEKLRACDGCSLQDSQRKTYYLNCKVRKCAITNGLENCGYCKGFPCEELIEVHSIQKIENHNDFIQKTGKDISDKDYWKFIEPYTGLNHLEKIRQGLNENDYKDYKKFSMLPKFASFDKIDQKQESLKIIYSLLTSLQVADNVSYAKFQTLTTKRKKLLQILWAICYHGQFNQAEGYIELDGKTFLSQKILSMHKVLAECFMDLKNYDIHCETLPFDGKKWLSPTGGLRKEGWKISLSFGASLSGRKTLIKFIDYVSALKDEYGSNGFRRLYQADLNVMI